MKAFARMWLAVLGLPCLAGCFSAIRDQAQVDPIVASVAPFRTPFGDKGQPIPIVPNCTVQAWVERAAGTGKVPLECPQSDSSKTMVTLAPYTNSRKPLDPITRRTQAQAELMTYADQICDDHVAGIYSKHAGVNFDLGLLTMLFSGASAVASGRAATNLAAESALFSGTRSLVNSEVYYGYIGPAVMREVRSLRADLRAEITAKRSCSLNEYPPQEAIDDALVYHDACSFSSGLASLLSKAGNSKVGEDKLRVAQLKAMAAQLSSKKDQLDKAESELESLPAADASSAKAQLLKDRIASLMHEIASSESVLRFSGVVDPDAGSGTPQNPDDVVDEAKRTVDLQTDALQFAKSATEKVDAQAALDAAKGNLDRAQTRRDMVNALTLRIGTLEKDIGDLSARQAQLASSKDSLAASDRTQRAVLDRQISQVADDIRKKKAEASEKKEEKKQATVPETIQKGIEFGIQQCTPLKSPANQ